MDYRIPITPSQKKGPDPSSAHSYRRARNARSMISSLFLSFAFGLLRMTFGFVGHAPALHFLVVVRVT
ncbi:hypothetical protein AGR1B_pa0062 [Agrobacterium fabacearum S56]|nr:hypothetical protein AGR1B_pa0062 [Agrobacterium fabacearum S56]